MTRIARPSSRLVGTSGQTHGTARRSVLVVDDDDRLRGRLIRALKDRGFDARGAANAAEAIAKANEETPECAIVDVRMPSASGLEVVRHLRDLDPTTRTVVLSGYGSIATAVEAMRSGAVHYLTKPADLDQILRAFELDGTPPGTDVPPAIPSLSRVAWEHIQGVLVRCNGNISRASRLLSLHRRSLQRKLAKHPQER